MTSPAATDSDVLRRLQDILDRSLATASPAVRETFGQPDRQMTAAEFVAFWQAVPLVAVATVGPNGQPHIAPVHTRLEGDRIVTSVFEKATRRKDLRANARIALTAWLPDRSAAIVYGKARELPDSRRPARPGRGGGERYVVVLEIEITRIYALKGTAT